MEDDHSKDSKASSDEASSAEPTHDDAGSRRPYYECTFCKRGFSNAQALGGHMNIHRKDRSRARPPPPSALERADEDMEGYRYCSQYPGNYSAFYPPVSGPSRSYNMYFPASASSGREAVRTAAMDNSGSLQMPYEQCLFGEELRLGLSSTHGDATSAAVGGERRRQEVEEDELDLELRLGHQP